MILEEHHNIDDDYAFLGVCTKKNKVLNKFEERAKEEFAVDVLFFKVWNKSRDLKTIVKLEESEDNLLNKLIGKASEKLYLNGIKLVLESDGTTIDEDEILRVIKSDVFILLQPKEEWEPPQPNTCTSTSTSIGEVIEYDYQIRQLNRDYNAFTWDNFEINWEQFPSYVLRTCTKGKREKQVITHIIHSIVNKMREIKTHIPTYAFKVVSRKLIEKYPNMFLDVDEDGVVIADGCHSVYKKLQDRNNYLNRPYKRKPSHKRNNSRDHSNRLGTRSDCMFLTPDNADAATEATEDYNDEDDAFYENLEKTFTGQRNFIKSNPTYDEIKKQWPVLLNGRAIIWHFNKLTNLNLYRMGEKVVERYQKFLKLAYSSKIDVASEEELLQIVKILSVYFKEDFNCFYTESETLPKEDEIEGVYPHIIAVSGDQEKTEYFIFFNRTVLGKPSTTFLEAFQIAFALFFNFGIQYPQKLMYTLEVIQRYFLKIHPDTGTSSGKQTAAMSRVINLLNKLKSL